MPEVALPALDTTFDDIASVKRACAAFRASFEKLRTEIGKVIVGQDGVVEQTLIALFANGHVLLEGVPGLGKTLLVRTLARALSLPFSRIQFTPDLMPADITGTSVVLEDPATGRRSFTFRPGPIFHQLVLADEINRATPKSQSALLEAMQERSVTVGGTTHALHEPFLVMATQNPIEQEGTYPLPEAQLDRFLFKIIVPYTTQSEMNRIVGQTTGIDVSAMSQIMDGQYIQQGQRLAQRIVVAPHVQDYVIRLAMATRPGSGAGEAQMDRYIRVGASPRGAQALIRSAKVRALMRGRYAVAFEDITAVAGPSLRHRLLRSFEAEADGVSTDDIINRQLETIPRDEEEAPDG